MILAVPLALAMSAAAPPVQHVAQLTCGSLDLRLTSFMATGVLAPTSQILTRRLGEREVRIPLESAQTVMIDGQRVRKRYILSWACLSGHDQPFVVIGYVCAIDLGYPRDCGGDKEWFRLLDRRGRFADAGMPHDGPRRERLYARLGISDMMEAGVPMKAVVE